MQDSSTIPAYMSINFLTARSSTSVTSRVTFCIWLSRYLYSQRVICMNWLTGFWNVWNLVKLSFWQWYWFDISGGSTFSPNGRHIKCKLFGKLNDLTYMRKLCHWFFVFIFLWYRSCLLGLVILCIYHFIRINFHPKIQIFPPICRCGKNRERTIDSISHGPQANRFTTTSLLLEYIPYMLCFVIKT